MKLKNKYLIGALALAMSTGILAPNIKSTAQEITTINRSDESEEIKELKQQIEKAKEEYEKVQAQVKPKFEEAQKANDEVEEARQKHNLTLDEYNAFLMKRNELIEKNASREELEEFDKGTFETKKLLQSQERDIETAIENQKKIDKEAKDLEEEVQSRKEILSSLEKKLQTLINPSSRNDNRRTTYPKPKKHNNPKVDFDKFLGEKNNRPRNNENISPEDRINYQRYKKIQEIKNLKNLTRNEQKVYIKKLATIKDVDKFDEEVNKAKIEDTNKKSFNLEEYKKNATEYFNNNFRHLSDSSKKSYLDQISKAKDKKNIDDLLNESKEENKNSAIKEFTKANNRPRNNENISPEDRINYQRYKKIQEIKNLKNLTRKEQEVYIKKLATIKDVDKFDEEVNKAKIEGRNKKSFNLEVYKKNAKEYFNNNFRHLSDSSKKSYLDQISKAKDKKDIDDLLNKSKEENKNSAIKEFTKTNSDSKKELEKITKDSKKEEKHTQDNKISQKNSIKELIKKKIYQIKIKIEGLKVVKEYMPETYKKYKTIIDKAIQKAENSIQKAEAYQKNN